MFTKWRYQLSNGKGIRVPLSDGSVLYVVPMSVFRQGSCCLMATCTTGGTLIYGRRKKPALKDLVTGGFESLAKACEITDFLAELYRDGSFLVRKRDEVSAPQHVRETGSMLLLALPG